MYLQPPQILLHPSTHATCFADHRPSSAIKDMIPMLLLLLQMVKLAPPSNARV